MSHGSQQLRKFRISIRDGMDLEGAAAVAGMSIEEARLTLVADRANPPDPEAYQIIQQAKEPDMAEEEQDSTEYKRPDAAKAFDIYDKQIAPKLTHLSTLKGDLSQPYDDIKQHANFPRKVLNFIIGIESEEDDSKRDHLLLALAEGLKHRQLFLPRDLVTMADGEDGGDIVPSAARDDAGLLIDEDEGGDKLDAAEIAAMRASSEPVGASVN